MSHIVFLFLKASIIEIQTYLFKIDDLISLNSKKKIYMEVIFIWYTNIHEFQNN